METTAPEPRPRGRRRARNAEAPAPAPAPDSAALEPQLLELREENQRMRHALQRTDRIQNELHELLDQLTAEPWPIARLQRLIETARGPRALVVCDGGRRLVSLHAECAAHELEIGDFVQLSQERNLLMATLGVNMPSGGELARFERFTADGRIVVRVRDEELIVDSGARLELAALGAGDPVRVDRSAELALERFEPEDGQSFVLEDVGDYGRERIGGLGDVFDELFEGLALPLIRPSAASALDLAEPPAALLHGPPGCGKTLIARCLAAELERATGRRCRFAVVRPGEFKNSYVGETEARIRACFLAMKRAGRDELAVLFLDEFDSIARVRGGPTSQHDDSALGALLAEIDGFEKRGNVALIAATNRRDVIDGAVISRFQGMDLSVGRPGRGDAGSIFGIHLPETLPFAASADTGSDPAAAREAAITSAVAQLYAPSGGGEVCRIGLRDGTTRDVHARELMSGRLIEHIARMAKRRALARHHRGDALGLAAADLDAAIGRVITDLSTLLTPRNARAHLADLPDDGDVVRVDSLRPRVARAARIAHAG